MEHTSVIDTNEPVPARSNAERRIEIQTADAARFLDPAPTVIDEVALARHHSVGRRLATGPIDSRRSF